MCLAIPAKIVEFEEDSVANCQVGESETFIKVNLMLLDGEAKIGDYVIVHAGFALRILDEADAQETLKLLRQLAETMGEPAGF